MGYQLANNNNFVSHPNNNSIVNDATQLINKSSLFNDTSLLTNNNDMSIL